VTAAGVTVDSSTFATIIGVSFTATVGLMAYIVKTLVAINSAQAVLHERVDGLERREGFFRSAGQRGAVSLRLSGVIGAIVVILVVFWGALFANVHYDSQRQQDQCLQVRRQYAGQVLYTKFLAKEFHATRAQKQRGLHDLFVALGPRPQC
jgi:hypothetical protein